MSSVMTSLIKEEKQKKEYEGTKLLEQNKKQKDILGKILYTSNLDYCNDAHEMQDRLEEIHELIKKNFPKLKERE